MNGVLLATALLSSTINPDTAGVAWGGPPYLNSLPAYTALSYVPARMPLISAQNAPGFSTAAGGAQATTLAPDVGISDLMIVKMQQLVDDRMSLSTAGCLILH